MAVVANALEGYCEEDYLDDFVSTYLITDEQAAELHRRNLTYLKLVRGRFTADDEAFVRDVFAAWNAKLGETLFKD
jgi:hypothetical protein